MLGAFAKEHEHAKEGHLDYLNAADELNASFSSACNNSSPGCRFLHVHKHMIFREKSSRGSTLAEA